MRPQFLDLTNNQSETEERQMTLAEYKEASITTKIAGRAVIRVVKKCNEAQENQNLDLSECQLMQIPEAVFHLMRNTILKRCDLSFNQITKLSPKLGLKFSSITELNVSNNRLSKLPDELTQLRQLTTLDFSWNSFLVLPSIVYILPKLEKVNAEKNFIADIDSDRLKRTPSLKFLNLKENPLSERTNETLVTITGLTLQLPDNSNSSDEWDENN